MTRKTLAHAPAPKILRNAGATEAELCFYDPFGPDWYGYVSVNTVQYALNQLSPGTALRIFFNSEGGDVFQAAKIYSLLNAWTGTKTAIITMAWSCASWVAQACDKRIMDENGLLMIHDPKTQIWEDSDAAELRKMADLLEKVKGTISGVYASRTGKDAAAIDAAMAEETWYTAAEALAFGLVDEVNPNKGPVGTNRLDSSRFRNAPAWLQPPAPGSEPWKRLLNERRQLLNELELQA